MQSLGTDGFGLSDTRPALRRHFHVDAESIVVRTLASLADWGQLDRDVVRQAVEKYQIRDVQAAPAEERSDQQPRDLSAWLTAVARALRVTVVGGGVIGLTCALELARAGHRGAGADRRPGRARRRPPWPRPSGSPTGRPGRRRAALGDRPRSSVFTALADGPGHRRRAAPGHRRPPRRRSRTCGGRRPCRAPPGDRRTSCRRGARRHALHPAGGATWAGTCPGCWTPAGAAGVEVVARAGGPAGRRAAATSSCWPPAWGPAAARRRHRRRRCRARSCGSPTRG